MMLDALVRISVYGNSDLASEKKKNALTSKDIFRMAKLRRDNGVTYFAGKKWIKLFSLLP